MRIKVESAPPLPPVKAWFSTHSATTVLELKSVLCADLHALRDDGIQGQDIALVLDDFELLDASPIDVVRDGDLVVIKRNPATRSHKRKARSPSPGVARKRTKRASLPTKPRPASPRPRAVKRLVSESSGPESSSSSGSESSSSSGSESDTESDSETDSSISSESSSSSSSASSAPSTEPFHLSTRNAQMQAPATSAQSHKEGPSQARTSSLTENVPPGLGKPTTHSRNLRRRRKRMYERLATTAEPASVNSIPLGTRAQTAEIAGTPVIVENPQQPAELADASMDVAPRTFMMSSLQNKNKKKGFKKAMTAGIPAKVVFATEDGTVDAPATEENAQQTPPSDNTEQYKSSLINSHLVPPSEKQELGLLPSNMFVTSVDVEEGMSRKRRKRRQALYNHEHVPEEEDEAVNAIRSNKDQQHSERPSSDLPNADTISKKWDALPKVQERSQLTAGKLELGLNYQTCTPEMLTRVGRVVGDDDQQRVVIERYDNEGPEEVAPDNRDGGVSVLDYGSQESHEWREIAEGDWRLVDEEALTSG
ncbi:uncharacterized protein LAESUDRAFT_754192 [Laetiporus sulphureus 93-53]|uniref:Uncharacterized protein n=1 Tax=Laetiporus sulphureus 93-53 TaxID=1314785 RepID=A0A165IKC3_9APHY|nr:uncharacterized protein LAESUDRAFT_754192 [Laetiporus sulphureus 93-53]KZT13197.1 hypothetical protein LAESUDRAFT_754192 [Laetiporus sulphureus 93-53]